MDCGGAQGPISDSLLQNVSILSPNETELARLTGDPPFVSHLPNPPGNTRRKTLDADFREPRGAVWLACSLAAKSHLISFS